MSDVKRYFIDGHEVVTALDHVIECKRLAAEKAALRASLLQVRGSLAGGRIDLQMLNDALAFGDSERKTDRDDAAVCQCQPPIPSKAPDGFTYCGACGWKLRPTQNV